VSLLWLEIAGVVALATDKNEERHGIGGVRYVKRDEVVVRESRGKWLQYHF
jgi:hypothetical protein